MGKNRQRSVLCYALAGALLAGGTGAHASRTAAASVDWPHFGNTTDQQRYSTLRQINARTIARLGVAWTMASDPRAPLWEDDPVVVDGVMYTVQAPNDIVALDAATGRIFWIYSYSPAPQARLCCGRVNRGLAILGDTLFMGTIDAHIVAVDSRNGHLLWNTKVADPLAGYAITHAPLVVKDKVIIGTAGGE